MLFAGLGLVFLLPFLLTFVVLHLTEASGESFALGLKVEWGWEWSRDIKFLS